MSRDELSVMDGCRYYLLAPSVEQLLGVFGNSES
jgi:hypothetical protein